MIHCRRLLRSYDSHLYFRVPHACLLSSEQYGSLKSWRVGNRTYVGSVKSFLAHFSLHSEEWSSLFFFDLYASTTTALVIFGRLQSDHTSLRSYFDP